MVAMSLRASRNPGFLWQGVLILLPVAVLAAVGVLSLRQDRLVAEHEATQRAQGIAEALAAKLWAQLVLTSAPPREVAAFLLDTKAQLVFPPACPSAPAPARFDISLLKSNQPALWFRAQKAEPVEDEAESAIRSYRDFLASDPPAQFAAAAEYALGLLLASRGNPEEASHWFELLERDHPEATGESGLPLAPLARLKSIEAAMSSTSADPSELAQQVEALCSNTVWRPTPLSSEILHRIQEKTQGPAARAAIANWRRIWEEHETARECFSELARAGVVTNDQPAKVWTVGDQDRLLVRLPTSTGTWIWCYPEAEVSARLAQLVEQEKQVPEYFAVGMEVAGEKFAWPTPDLRIWDYAREAGRRNGAQEKAYSSQLATNVLASAPAPESAGLLKANVYLTSPAALFARERVRAIWIAGLVAAAALAAAVGFFSAYHAFQRQLRLSDLKSNFVSSVSHELRAPIASVRLMAESLEQGKIADAAKQGEYFRFIRQECRRLSSLVENILDFSRIEQGRKQYEFEPTDLAALVQQTVHLMQNYAEEKGVGLALDAVTPSGAAAVWQPLLDGKAIQQALVNLIDNAIKHSPKGQVVRVRLELKTSARKMRSAHDLGPNAILLSVEDQGEGIPPDEHRRILRTFLPPRFGTAP